MSLEKVFKKYSRISRQKKLDLFFRLLQPSPQSTFLDLGGGSFSDEYKTLYGFFENVIVVNIDNRSYISEEFPNVTTIKWDGCYLRRKIPRVDYIYCNAVIEHVGDWGRQKLLATEIKECAEKGYFVSTPNYYFPIEPHYRLPFVQLVPLSVRKVIVQRVHGQFHGEEIRLLKPKEMKALFDDAVIIMNRVTFWPETIVASRSSINTPREITI